MPIKIVKRYTRQEIRANKNDLYVFGDNFIRDGYGGQAYAARDEPNAVGIATKKTPSHEDIGFLKPRHFDLAKTEYDEKFDVLFKHLDKGGTVVWPEDGIGTGLADLENKAPKIWKYLQQKVKQLLAYNKE